MSRRVISDPAALGWAYEADIDRWGWAKSGSGGGDGGGGGGDDGDVGLNGSAYLPSPNSDYYTISQLAPGDTHFADNVFSLLQGDFTVEMWVRSESGSLSLYNPSQTSDAPGLFISNNGYLRWNNAYGKTNLWELPTAKLNGTPTQWHHIRVCRHNEYHLVYIDGVNRTSELTGNTRDQTNYNTREIMTLGRHSESASNSAAYADIRIIRGAALSTGQASFALPTSPVGPSDVGETLLCLSFAGGDEPLDISGKDQPIAAVGNARGDNGSPYNSLPYVDSFSGSVRQDNDTTTADAVVTAESNEEQNQ